MAAKKRGRAKRATARGAERARSRKGRTPKVKFDPSVKDAEPGLANYRITRRDGRTTITFLQAHPNEKGETSLHLLAGYLAEDHQARARSRRRAGGLRGVSLEIFEQQRVPEKAQ